MNRTDLARARTELLTKRPAEVIRAEPVTLTAVRAIPHPLQPSAWQRFHAWRRRHYAADQALRVAAIVVGLVALNGLAALLLVALVGSLVDGSVLKGMALVAALLVVAFLTVSVGKRGGREHSGYGFHWTKCK